MVSAYQQNDLNNIAIIIPAYNPSTLLLNLTDDVLCYGFNNIIIVNDGSAADCNAIFEELKNKGITVITHQKNQGKGCALKSAFTFCLNNNPLITNIITVDADGQHHPKDVMNIAKNFSDKRELLLGVRTFSKEVPLRSKIGNILTRKLFSVVTGMLISDTQTGLRGISSAYLPALSKLNGNGYEYEMNMLLTSKSLGFQVKEIPIDTLYFDNNKSSHFNPIKDSFKIFFVLLKSIFFRL